MPPCPSLDALAACARGELDEGVRAAIELHIDSCAACRIALSEAGRRAPADAGGPSLPEPGEIVGRYEIGARLGEGAMGVVFAARDHELARDVAVKILRPQLGASEDELVRQRMLREGRALARIDHPNVVRVLDVGEWRASLFVVMERLSGVTLRVWLATDPPARAIREVLVQCARGLAAAHAVEVVHRDFKPDNAIVNGDGWVRVADFGLALTDGAAGTREADIDDDAASPRLTRTHGTLGTPAYMAPEQRRGATVDARSDQYAWCLVATEALPLARWPRRARRALQRGLADEPSARWASLDELLVAAAPTHRRRWLVAAAAVLALGVAVIARAGGGNACDATLGWAGPREARAAMAFAANPSPGAAAAWRYVDGAVARYETSWRAMRVSACRDREPAIARCLDRRRDELLALVARWAPGARETLAIAPQSVDGLEPVERCQSPETTVAGASPALEAEFAAARADRLAGRMVVANRAFLALLPRVTDPGLRAQIEIDLGATQRSLGNLAGAREHLVAGVAAAELAGASHVKVFAWLGLAELANQDLVVLSQAREALQLAGAVVERLGNPPDLVRALDFERGLLLIREGHPNEGAIKLEGSIVPDLPATALARRSLAIARAELDVGRFADALASVEHAERTLTAALGSDAGTLAPVENALVEPLRLLGRDEEAIAHGERSLALLAANFGAATPFRRGVLSNLATVYADAGKVDRAIAIEREVLSLATTDLERGTFEANLGSMLTQAHHLDEARSHLERGRALLIRVLGEQHPTIANAEELLALLEEEAGHFARALDHGQRALAIRERTGAAPEAIASAKTLVARLLVKTRGR